MSCQRARLDDVYAETALDVYLLPKTPWEETNLLLQRLTYELSEEPRRRAALVLCEHPPIITVGRRGSRGHIDLEEEELRARRLEIRWTNRGGGCWLQTPGQLAIYPVVPIHPTEVGLARYRTALYESILSVLDEFHLRADHDSHGGGVHVDGRQIAGMGLAVKNWVAYHGCWINVCVPPEWFDGITLNPTNGQHRPTSMFRELCSPIRTETVRESFLRKFVDVFGFQAYYLCRPPRIYPVRKAANVVG
ncbi:Octanoyltransferase [Planctomycetes bacterium Pan216]|uniref:Octanoyltransferase n=1 Tax=Kolteria novifilia TaxID=2527975 RepID=A0A518BA35_9BACT|nr:Octanoyltransferase [Planctomycetes bacterium Pan216]